MGNRTQFVEVVSILSPHGWKTEMGCTHARRGKAPLEVMVHPFLVTEYWTESVFHELWKELLRVVQVHPEAHLTERNCLLVLFEPGRNSLW